MNIEERVQAMNDLPKYIRKSVVITYINQMNKKDIIIGELRGVNPYNSIEVTHLKEIPKEIQHWDIFKGETVLEAHTGIPFLGTPDAIMSIFTLEGLVLYQNEHVYPFYNPFFFPNKDENGILRTGINYEAGVEYTEKIRELSFGRNH
ncbi:hypothetical protein HY837_02655 [archaeon]|nr:hypothetical protein [archaeon]